MRIHSHIHVQGVEAFLDRVIEQCALPVFLYNFPKHTGNVITPKM